MPSKPLAAKVEADVAATVRRVRRRLGWAPVFIHGHGVIAPGEFTEAITPEEAAQRADFEVVAVPVTPPATDDPPPAPSETEG